MKQLVLEKITRRNTNIKKQRFSRTLAIKKQKRFIQLFRFKQFYNMLKLKVKNKFLNKKKTLLSFYLTSTNPKVIKTQSNELNSNWGLVNQIQNLELINTVNSNENVFFYQAKSIVKTSALYYTFKKEVALLRWNNVRQLTFFLDEFILSLHQNSKKLISETAQLNYTIVASQNVEQIFYANYIKQTLSHLFFKKRNIVLYNNTFNNNIIFNNFQTLLILHYFNLLLSKVQLKDNLGTFAIKRTVLNFIDASSTQQLNFWEKSGVTKAITLSNKNMVWAEELQKKREKINYIYRRRSSNLSKPHLLIGFKSLQTLQSEELALQLRNYIWKRKSGNLTITDSIEQDKLAHLRNKKLRISRKKVSPQLLYVLSRIDNKIEKAQTAEVKTNLVNLKTILLSSLEDKQKHVSTNNMIYTERGVLKEIRKKTVSTILEDKLKDEKYVNSQLFETNKKYQRFIYKLLDSLEKSKKSKTIKKNYSRNKVIKSFTNYENIALRRRVRALTNNLKWSSWKNKLQYKAIQERKTRINLIKTAKQQYIKIINKENDKEIKDWLEKIIKWEDYHPWLMDVTVQKMNIKGLSETLKNTLTWRRRYVNIRKLRRQAREKTYRLRWKNQRKRQNNRYSNKNSELRQLKKTEERKSRKHIRLKDILLSSSLRSSFKTRFNRYLWIYGYYRYSYFSRAWKEKANNKVKQLAILRNQKGATNQIKLNKKSRFVTTFKRAKGLEENTFMRKLLKKVRVSLKIKKKRLFRWNINKNIYLKCKSWNKSWRKKKARVRRTWINVQPVIKGNYTTFAQKKLLLAAWAGFPLNLFMINTLALTKLSFKLDRLKTKHNNPNLIISKIDREYINRYKYVAIYIKDLIRIGLISMFFKKPSFLAKFTAFQLAKLPRNRKETVFIRFLMKAIRTFSAGRKEIVALRMKFKGRVNRWRRTKFIMRTRGTLPFQTITERIEHGSAQAVNRKGAVGIHIWIRYKPSFLLKMHDHVLAYMKYSSGLKNMRKKKINNIIA